MFNSNLANLSARSMRMLAAVGALACFIGVGLGAHAAHGALTPQNHDRLAIAAIVLFANGLGLASLAPGTSSRYGRSGLFFLLLGMIVFSGSLTLAALFGFEPTYASLGGSFLLTGWALVAIGFLIE